MTAHPTSATLEASEPIAGQKTINLALQGGGSHGAFTWGVLDRLLDEERLTFDGVTATSAGGVNAVLLADGLAQGGREGAKELMRTFWKKMSETTSKSIIAPSFIDKMNPSFGLDHSPGYVMVDMISRFMSPYQLNPMDANPMRDLLNEVVNFERIQQQKVIKLFLSATNVRTGKVAVFPTSEVTADHVLASACLPFMMRAPEINGEYYWDGGFMGNPAIFPVIYGCKCPGRSPGSPHADRAARASDQLPRDPQPHAGDQLQFVSDAGNAGCCVRDPDDRRGQADRRQTNVHPPDRGRRNHQGFGGLQQNERRMEIPDVSFRDRPRTR